MNEIEQKEIEEMAIIDCQRVPKGLDCSACQFANVYNCNSYRMATRLYNAGYKNCKDKVVLTREEYAKLRNLEINYENTYKNYREYAIENNKLKEELAKASELKAETIRLAKIEAVRGFWKALKNVAYRSSDWSHGEHPMVVELDYIEEIGENFGVEVE